MPRSLKRRPTLAPASCACVVAVTAQATAADPVPVLSGRNRSAVCAGYAVIDDFADGAHFAG